MPVRRTAIAIASPFNEEIAIQDRNSGTGGHLRNDTVRKIVLTNNTYVCTAIYSLTPASLWSFSWNSSKRQGGGTPALGHVLLRKVLQSTCDGKSNKSEQFTSNNVRFYVISHRQKICYL